MTPCSCVSPIRRQPSTAKRATSNPSTIATDPRDRKVREVRAEPKHARDGDADGGGVKNERRRIVQETLALDDRDQVPRNPQALENRRRRELVGRRDDRTEHERHRPTEVADDGMGDDRDHDRGRRHQADRQHPNLTGIRLHHVGRRRDRFPVQ